MDDAVPPSPNGVFGRDPNSGRFGIGNKFSRGNPFAGKVSKLRSALLSAISEDDMTEIVQSLVASAKSGNLNAAKLILTYVATKPTADEADDPSIVHAGETPLTQTDELKRLQAELGPVTPENLAQHKALMLARINLVEGSDRDE
ncbi:hypothetical protein [Schlesneria sp. DSM 10557]|uniref:hypothetical protein n=1 Tax=Schlesneria sp. DSM 10557 TaxID=3044399 RepID=UPI0035A125A8